MNLAKVNVNGMANIPQIIGAINLETPKASTRRTVPKVVNARLTRVVEGKAKKVFQLGRTLYVN